jgi:hypothetical protein
VPSDGDLEELPLEEELEEGDMTVKGVEKHEISAQTGGCS